MLVVQKALEGSVKKYYVFYCLSCDEFSQTELEGYAVETWPWDPKPKVCQGEEILSPELLAGWCAEIVRQNQNL